MQTNGQKWQNLCLTYIRKCEQQRSEQVYIESILDYSRSGVWCIKAVIEHDISRYFSPVCFEGADSSHILYSEEISTFIQKVFVFVPILHCLSILDTYKFVNKIKMLIKTELKSLNTIALFSSTAFDRVVHFLMHL